MREERRAWRDIWSRHWPCLMMMSDMSSTFTSSKFCGKQPRIHIYVKTHLIRDIPGSSTSSLLSSRIHYSAVLILHITVCDAAAGLNWLNAERGSFSKAWTDLFIGEMKQSDKRQRHRQVLSHRVWQSGPPQGRLGKRKRGGVCDKWFHQSCCWNFRPLRTQ